VEKKGRGRVTEVQRHKEYGKRQKKRIQNTGYRIQEKNKAKEEKGRIQETGGFVIDYLLLIIVAEFPERRRERDDIVSTKSDGSWEQKYKKSKYFLFFSQ